MSSGSSLSRYGRPLLCTEYMARPAGSTFDPHPRLLKPSTVAAYNWGFVAGKTQTIYPWDSWKKAYTAEPPVWFHDIFRTTARLTGAGGRVHPAGDGEGCGEIGRPTGFVYSKTRRGGLTNPQATAPTRKSPPITNSGAFQSPSWPRRKVTISGLSTLPIWPDVFMVALTTPAWLPPMSMHVLQAGPRMNMLVPSATAISHAAKAGLSDDASQNHRRAREHVSGRSDAAARQAEAKTFGHRVRRDAAEQIAEHAEDQWQAGKEAKLDRVETMPLAEIRRQPSDAEIEREAVRKIHEAKRECVAVAEKPPPKIPAFVMAAAGLPATSNVSPTPPR